MLPALLVSDLVCMCDVHQYHETSNNALEFPMQPVRDLSDFVNSIRTDKSLKLRAYGLQFRRNRRRVAHGTAQPSDDHEDGQRVDAEADEKHASNTRSGVQWVYRRI